MPNNNEA